MFIVFPFWPLQRRISKLSKFTKLSLCIKAPCLSSTQFSTVCIMCVCVCVCVFSCFSHIWLFAIPWTVARQAPLSLGFSRQEYWNALPCRSPDLPYPGIEPESPALQADSLLLSHQGSPTICIRPRFKGHNWKWDGNQGKGSKGCYLFKSLFKDTHAKCPYHKIKQK